MRTFRTSPLFFLIPALLAGMFFSCKNDIEKVKKVMNTKDMPVQTTYDAEITYSDSGVIKVKLYADKMDRYIGERSYLEFPDGLKVKFFGSGEEGNAHLKANYGILYEEKNRMIVRDDVVFINRKGEKLNTEKLIWSQDSARIYTDKFVKITRKDGIIHGKGLTAKEDFSSYEILEPEGELYFDPEEENDTTAHEENE